MPFCASSAWEPEHVAAAAVTLLVHIDHNWITEAWIIPGIAVVTYDCSIRMSLILVWRQVLCARYQIRLYRVGWSKPISFEVKKVLYRYVGTLVVLGRILLVRLFDGFLQYGSFQLRRETDLGMRRRPDWRSRESIAQSSFNIVAGRPLLRNMARLARSFAAS